MNKTLYQLKVVTFWLDMEENLTFYSQSWLYSLILYIKSGRHHLLEYLFKAISFFFKMFIYLVFDIQKKNNSLFIYNCFVILVCVTVVDGILSLFNTDSSTCIVSDIIFARS